MPDPSTNSTMTLFQIPEFTGEPEECVKTFIRLVDAAFTGISSVYSIMTEKETAKILLLILNTGGIAQT